MAKRHPQSENQVYVVSRGEARKTLAEWLHRRLDLPWSEARQLVKEGHVRLDDRPCLDANQRLQRGQRLALSQASRGRFHQTPESSSSGRSRSRLARKQEKTRIVIRFVDAHVVVVDKPAGLTTMRHTEEAAEFGRGRRFLPTTLADLLPPLLAKEGGGKPPPPGRPRGRGPEGKVGPRLTKVRAVHRLDKDTSGLVVFVRTAAAEGHLGKQFRAHTTERRYLAVVRGQAQDARIESRLVRDRGDGRRGSSPTSGEGQRAVTHVRVLERLGDYTLVECRLETGRTHQVRIHLGEAGTPLCGESIYDRPLNGKPLPDGSGMKRVALHAATLGFDHPATGKRVRWTASLPQDMKDLVERLRRPGRQTEATPEGP